MPFSPTRRRFVAAFAALGATGLLSSLARARAAENALGDEVFDGYVDNVVACSTSSTNGTFADPANNYRATATGADFAFVGRIKAMGDSITLFADEAHGGVGTENLALVKGSLTRTAPGAPLLAATIGFETPLTAVQQAGQYYGIVQMSHDQGVTAAVMFYQDDAQVGGWELKKGEFDPNSREVSFAGDGAAQIFGWLRSGAAFRMDLVAGNQAYSSLSIENGAFDDFVDNTLVQQMDAMAVQDTTDPCDDLYDDWNGSSGYEGCFLTTACCGVVGLADDCWELTTLRQFRDGWLRGFVDGRADIERYYREAPVVASRLGASRAGRARLLRLYWRVIVPSAVLIRLGANRLAWRLYRRMMLDLLPALAARRVLGSRLVRRDEPLTCH